MQKIFTEFNVVVKGRCSNDFPITEQRVYSEHEAFYTARNLSALYPAYQIVIEEWKYIQSKKIFKSGYYRGRTIYYTPEAA